LTIKFSQDKKAAYSIVKERDDLFQPQTLGGEFLFILFWWLRKMVELTGIEPATSGVQNRRSPS
jgi:hypothetical protein